MLFNLFLDVFDVYPIRTKIRIQVIVAQSNWPPQISLSLKNRWRLLIGIKTRVGGQNFVVPSYACTMVLKKELRWPRSKISNNMYLFIDTYIVILFLILYQM